MNEIDNVNWSQVRGAYGPIPQMPQHLRALGSSDVAISDAALRWLSDNLIHQGTRWQATPIAVPFLMDALAQPTTRNKDEIILLLLALAVDGNVPPIPGGFDPDAEFAEVRDVRIDPVDVQAIWNTPDWERLDQRLWAVLNIMPKRDRYDAYLAVERRADLFSELVGAAEPAVRRPALWSLGWFPRMADQSVPAVRLALAGETEEFMLANILIILGLLGWYLNDQSDVPAFETFLKPDHPRIIRRAAAIAAGTVMGTAIPPLALDLLMEGSEDKEHLERDTKGLGWPWNAPSLKGCYWRVIHSLGL